MFQGIGEPLKKDNGKKKHEWKTLHGFREFYKTRAEQTIKPIHVELTLGRSIGISDSYYRATEKDLLKDYMKAVADFLTISNENRLKKQVNDISKQSNESLN